MRENIDNPTILERAGRGDKTAIEECVALYGSFIWGLAIEFTDTKEAAEAMALDIFYEIWKYAEKFDAQKFSEERFINVIAHHCVTQYLINKK